MSYYAAGLSGVRLRRCYDIAPPRVRQYLEAEIAFVLDHLHPGQEVLELGCGYGRVAFRLGGSSRRVVGIDTAEQSLALARELAGDDRSFEFRQMDAAALEFTEARFDAVVCVQNGICAFRADPMRLLQEATRVARPGGTILLSTYAERFWPHRLEWFRLQAREGLVGEIDEVRTRDGTIQCRDGFCSGTMSAQGLRDLCSRLGVAPALTEVDESSLFCVVTKPPEQLQGRK